MPSSDSVDEPNQAPHDGTSRFETVQPAGGVGGRWWSWSGSWWSAASSWSAGSWWWSVGRGGRRGATVVVVGGRRTWWSAATWWSGWSCVVGGAAVVGVVVRGPTIVKPSVSLLSGETLLVGRCPTCRSGVGASSTVAVGVVDAGHPEADLLGPACLGRRGRGAYG